MDLTPTCTLMEKSLLPLDTGYESSHDPEIVYIAKGEARARAPMLPVDVSVSLTVTAMSTPKASGSQNRKRKRREKLEDEKSAKTMSLFLNQAEKSKTATEDVEVGPQLPEVVPVAVLPLSQEDASLENAAEKPETCKYMYNDISLWPKPLAKQTRDQIVMEGPQPLPPSNYNYPKDDKNRHFSSSYGIRVLKNNETATRRWLQYSVSSDKAYCFCCKLFDPMPKSNLGSDGINNWNHIGDYLKTHERSPEHFKSCQKWLDAERCMKGNEGIDKDLQTQIHSETSRWRAVLERIMAVVVFLSKNNLAFRGNSNKLFTPNNGNFLSLIELLGKFDPVMMDHLRRVTSQEIHSHYCGNLIQNELISLMGSQVKNAILDKAKVAKYFSVILDCTPDVSHTEQLSYTIRFVDIAGEEISVNEHFLGYRPANDTSGEGLTKLLYCEISECGLEMDNCRGQGYDNGANMIGINKGVQKRVLEQYPRAFFNPCGCHSLNLVVGDASKTSVKSVSLFGVLQRLYNLFAASTKRWSILSEHVQSLSLKKVCETRWECRIESLKAVRYQFSEILDALSSMEKNITDPTLSSEAKSLASHLEDYSFILTLVVWYDLLFQVNLVSKSMQSRNIDLPSCNELLKNCIKFVKNYRSSGYESAMVTAKEIASDLEIETTFKTTKRQRKKKRMFEYETHDETPEDEEEHYKSTVFYTLIDNMTASLESRFGHLTVHNKRWGFLYNIKMLPEKDELLKLCKDLEHILDKNNVSVPESTADIDGIQLAEELRHIQPTIQKNSVTPLEVLQHIHNIKAHGLFPNVWVAMRILLTIPITVASGERSFSKLKLIKTYLRSTMAEERLSALAIISIENEMVEKIDYAAAIKTFAAAKSRKVQFV